jgi:5-formyltetrahydrofolate cyclo-ligase
MTNRRGRPEDVGRGELSDKQALRARQLAARRAMDAGARAAADVALAEQAARLVRGRGTVAAYVPMTGEPGGSHLLAALAGVVVRLLLPVLLPDGDLDWTAYAGELDEPGPAGFRAASGARLGPDAIAGAEAVLVPALAVAPDGARLGRGGGSYDRALVRVARDTPVWALLYEGELLPAVPTQPHDRAVSGVLLPGGPQSCRSRLA